MIDQSLNTVKSKIGNPLRTNRFYADFPALDGSGIEEDVTYFLNSMSTPTKTISEIIIFWQGLQYKVPGDLTFAPLSVTFMTDENLSAYNYMMFWQDLVVNDLDNTRGALSDVKKIIELHQLSDNGGVKATWSCNGLFPTEVGEVSFDREGADTVGTFTVQFAMDNFTYSQSNAINLTK
jgi:hypothetical protein